MHLNFFIQKTIFNCCFSITTNKKFAIDHSILQNENHFPSLAQQGGVSPAA